MSDDILYDLRHKQRLQEPRDMHKEPLWGRAADEIERLRGELLLITQLQAGDGSTVNGLTKDQLGRAFRQAQDIARAALGIVTHGDSISGSVNPDQPSAATGPVWVFGTSVGINDHIEFCYDCHYSRVWIAEHGHGKDCPHRATAPTDAAP